MKINKIKINDYHQFEKFEIDLTYPKGHKKEGFPLDKVCFIGQNGTGKTTLLDILNELTIENNYHNNMSGNVNDPATLITWNNFTEKDKIYEINVSYPFTDKNDNSVYKVIEKGKNHFFSLINGELERENFHYFFNKLKTRLINVPAEMIDFNLSNKLENPLEYLKPISELNEQTFQEKGILMHKQIFDFLIDKPVEIWKSILFENSEYLIKEINFRNKIVDKLLLVDEKDREIIEEFKSWKKKNPYPLINIADKLNPLLLKFNLKIKIDLDFKRPEDLYFIQIQNSNDEDIPLTGWSSGTKQLILTVTPLITLNTWESIVLIDEPERSLFPDTQYEIIKYYTNLAPDAQFFFATHSPMIASSFEPWEIVELKFNDMGKVIQYPYFKGERHVDNYFIQPQYLRWDSILYKMFDVQFDGDSARKAKLIELTKIGLELEKLKKEGDKNPENSRRLWEAYKKAAELLDWKIESDAKN